MGVEVWQAAAMAAFIGLMEVAEDVSRAFVKDGDVTEAELNEIFGNYALDEDPGLAAEIQEDA